jgi:hypothetical protein
MIMVLRALLVFWLLASPLIGLFGGWPAMGAVAGINVLLAWWIGMGPVEIAAVAAVGAGATVFSGVLNKRHALAREMMAAAGLGLVVGLVTRPLFGLLGMSLLPVTRLLAHSRKVLLWALMPALIRLFASAFLALWLLVVAW